MLGPLPWSVASSVCLAAGAWDGRSGWGCHYSWKLRGLLRLVGSPSGPLVASVVVVVSVCVLLVMLESPSKATLAWHSIVMPSTDADTLLQKIYTIAQSE